MAFLEPLPEIGAEDLAVAFPEHLAQGAGQPEKALELLGENVVLPHREPRLGVQLDDNITLRIYNTV